MGEMADMANAPWVEPWEVSDHTSPHFDEALAWEREGESGVHQRRRVDKYAADKCPRCGADLRPVTGKHGPFMGCTRYPDCKGSRDGGGRSMSGQHLEINTAQLQQEAQLKLYREKGAVVFSISIAGALIFSGEITPEGARKFAARLQQCADGADAYAAEHGEDG